MIKEALPTTEKTEEQQLAELKKELFDRKCPKKYESLIEKVNFIKMQTPHAEDLYRVLKMEKFRELIKDKIKNKIVLDLGCGNSGWISSLLHELEAMLYIGVDLNPGLRGGYYGATEGPPDDSEWNLDLSGPIVEYKPKESKEETNIITPKFKLLENKTGSATKELEITDDMLHLISQIKKDSIDTIIISGIESLGTNPDITHQYLQNLDNEISQVLRSGGILIVYNSYLSPKKLDEILADRYLGVKIYEKQKNNK